MKNLVLAASIVALGGSLLVGCCGNKKNGGPNCGRPECRVHGRQARGTSNNTSNNESQTPMSENSETQTNAAASAEAN
jgi:hypothetical protein